MILRAFALPERDDQGRWIVVAIDESCRVFMRTTAATIPEQRAAISTALGQQLTKSTVWVEDPEAHPLTRRWLEEQAIAASPAEAIEDFDTIAALHEERHLCNRCVHERVCLLARAASQVHDATHATVTACQQFKETI